jgi:hypothetical protein
MNSIGAPLKVRDINGSMYFLIPPWLARTKNFMHQDVVNVVVGDKVVENEAASDAQNSTE